MIIKPELNSENINDKGDLAEKLASIKSGKVLEAIVLKVMAQNRAELRVLGQKMLVESETALEKGQKLLLKVAKNSSNKIILKLMNDIFHSTPKNRTKGQSSRSSLGKFNTSYNKIFQKDTPEIPFQKEIPNKAEKHLPNKTGIRSSIDQYIRGNLPKKEVDFTIQTKSIMVADKTIEGSVVKAVVEEIKSNGKYILSIKGKKTEASLTRSDPNVKEDIKIPFKKGDLLDLIVKKSGEDQTILTLKPSKNISKILISSGDIFPEEKLPFEVKKGDVFKAKVTEVPTPRHAKIEIKGEEILVRVNTPLKKGETLILRADKNGNNESFRIVTQDSRPPLEIREALLKSLGKAGPFESLTELLKLSESDIKKEDLNPETFSRIKKLVKEISLKSGTTDTAILRTLFKKSGLSWENKLSDFFASQKNIPNKTAFIENDLKALTMDFLAKFGDDSEPGIKIKSFVETMEQLQLLNSHSSEESGKYIMPIPIFGSDMFRFGQLLIDLNSKSKKDGSSKDKVLRVSFMLEMSNLGDLRADFSMLKKGITGAFGVESEEARRFIKNRLPELERNLNKHEFQVHKIDCFVIDENELKNRSLTDEILDDSIADDEILNIVV
jgi:hypothetical protein